MIKRLFDILFSLLGLILLSPIFLMVILKVRKNLGTPVFFKQVRPGKDGKPFTMIKFRSMRDAYDKNENPLSDAERLTPFGKKLRSTSLDELPELWNVLKGYMSLVCPRPLLSKSNFVCKYEENNQLLTHAKQLLSSQFLREKCGTNGYHLLQRQFSTQKAAETILNGISKQ